MKQISKNKLYEAVGEIILKYNYDIQHAKSEDNEHISKLNEIYKNVFKYEELLRIKDTCEFTRNLQKSGVDVLLKLKDKKYLTIEEKFRFSDYEDLLIEIWSAKERNSIGWTIDDKKITDYLVYVTNRIYFFDYKKLRNLAKENLDNWTNKYQMISVKNEGYTSINLIIPLNAVRDIYWTDDKVYFNNNKFDKNKLRDRYNLFVKS